MDSTIKEELAAISSRHLNISIGSLCVVVLLVSLMGYGLFRMNASFEKALGTFQQSQKDLAARLDTMQTNLDAQKKERDAADDRQKKTQTQIGERKKTTDTEVAKVTNPDMDTKQVAYLAKQRFSLDYDPLLTESQGLPYIGFQKRDVQSFMSYRIQLDAAAKDLADTKKLYEDEQLKSKSFAQSANEYQESLKQCQSTLSSCKTVAGLTKRQKFFGALKRYGTYAGIGWLAFELGAHK